MRILQACSEAHPYSKTGGLADMVSSLAKSLARLGHRSGVVSPLYLGIQERFPKIQKFDYTIHLPLGDRFVTAEVWTHDLGANLTHYFIHCPEFYFRGGLYSDRGVDYLDNPARFFFLSKCAAHLARYLDWQPEVVHVHDWQTSFVPLLIKHQKETAGWGSAPCCCLTIHNLAYQGQFDRTQYPLTNLPWDYYHPFGVEFYGGLCCLKAGIEYAHKIATVSPRYAQEITTPEFGCSLEGVLQRRARDLYGILNGVDYEEWNTDHNPHLKSKFTAARLQGKALAKRQLQVELGLPVRADVPLFGNISRLADQKGVDIMLEAMEEMLAGDIQFVLLGSGDPIFEEAFKNLGQRYPDKVAVVIGFDYPLSHRIEAGSDFFIMPSKFEPCGLNQMYSLRYGTIPIARRTGGLDDSVVDFLDNQELPNGIKFTEYSDRALVKAIRKALAIYRVPPLMKQFQQVGMKTNFSWEQSSQQYLALYKKAQHDQ